MEKFSAGERQPPCTPEQFEEAMQERLSRAKAKEVSLFTSGADQKFVMDKYANAFAELSRAE